ncbi:hypothetical protein HDU96_009741 [Phlyctochytrium bullatum]|nr:hypothetical protein HDU96_009741 [Phlyctochytrium bullatum]
MHLTSTETLQGSMSNVEAGRTPSAPVDGAAAQTSDASRRFSDDAEACHACAAATRGSFDRLAVPPSRKGTALGSTSCSSLCGLAKAKGCGHRGAGSSQSLVNGVMGEGRKPAEKDGDGEGGCGVGWGRWVAGAWLRSPSQRSQFPRTPSLAGLPAEIQERIFVLASNPYLAVVDRGFLRIAASPLVRAQWLLQRYGEAEALACCWGWRFVRCTPPDAEYLDRLQRRVAVEGEKKARGEAGSVFGELGATVFWRRAAAMAKSSIERLHIGKGLLTAGQRGGGEDGGGGGATDDGGRGKAETIHTGSPKLVVPGNERSVRGRRRRKDQPSSKCDCSRKTIRDPQRWPSPERAPPPPSGKTVLHRWWHLGRLVTTELAETVPAFLAGSLLRPYHAAALESAPWLMSPCAVERSECFVASLLLELGAAVWGGGNMALRVAARRGHLHLVELLLENGADPDAWVPLPSNPLLRWIRHPPHRVGGGAVVPTELLVPVAMPLSPAGGAQPMQAEGNANGPMTVEEFMNVNGVDGTGQQPQPGEPASGPSQQQASTRPLKTHNMKVSLLLQAVRANHVSLARILVRQYVVQRRSGAGQSTVKISDATLKAALSYAFRASRLEMCRVLVDEGGATSTMDMVHELVARASTWRLTIGVREKLSEYLLIGIRCLPPDDFFNISATLMRSSAEIGCPRVTRLCFERGADINVWEGLPLYASVYNGNLEVTRVLLDEAHVDVTFFGWKQKLFCTGLICIEGFAILMFTLLVLMWTVGMFQIIQSWITPGKGGGVVTITSYADGVSVGELTGMAVPSALALAVMYRLVPFHRMCIGFYLVCREHRRRRLQALAATAATEAGGGSPAIQNA